MSFLRSFVWVLLLIFSQWRKQSCVGGLSLHLESARPFPAQGNLSQQLFVIVCILIPGDFTPFKPRNKLNKFKVRCRAAAYDSRSFLQF